MSIVIVSGKHNESKGTSKLFFGRLPDELEQANFAIRI